MIRPYLIDIIIDYKTQGEWEIQLTTSITFISSNDSDETRNLRTKSDNIEIMMGDETDEIIDELLKSFFTKLTIRFRETIERNWVCFWKYWVIIL